MTDVESVTVNGLRYLVVEIRDYHYLAKLIAKELRHMDANDLKRDLEAEHRRMVPTEVIEEAAKVQDEGDPFPLELVEGAWRVKPPSEAVNE